MYFSKKKLNNIYQKENKIKTKYQFLKLNQFDLPAKNYQKWLYLFRLIFYKDVFYFYKTNSIC